MIEVKGLVKKYGNHIAVDHLDFNVEKGKIYGFLGPNGAGKSTTMNIMTGYLGATEGEVIINGHDIVKDPEEAKKCIGYLPELPPLYMDMTVLEYLQFAAELKKIPKQNRERAMEYSMELTKVLNVKNRLIKNLSKGYRQRVGLAQAILGFPEIIILDEPTVGLDPQQIIEIRELIRQLAKKHTVILSSHILAEVKEVCDEIMIISKGKLVACDTLDNLERLMEGTETVEIVAKTDTQNVENLLKNLWDVEKVTAKAQEDGTTFASIQAKAGKDIRESVFRVFAKADCPLLLLCTTKASLEDVFIELTQNEKADVLEVDQKADKIQNLEIGQEEQESKDQKEEAGNGSDL